MADGGSKTAEEHRGAFIISLFLCDMNEHDRKLIEWAEKQCFEDLDESMAETEEGKRKLHIIIMKKYHADEYSCGIL